MPHINSFVRIAALIFAAALAGCAGDFVGSLGGTPPAGNPGEQARLQLVDQCMFDLGRTGNWKEKTAPRCQCYARGVVAAGGSPLLARTQDIMSACIANENAFAESPRRSRAKKGG